ncbi:hypothetical protein ABFX02_06G024600 [Erythranthe guttata]
MEVNKGIKLEGTETEEFANNEVKLNTDHEGCASCLELQDKITELMIENEVLDCEKKSAEREIEVWKAKCIELEKAIICSEKSSFSSAENENKSIIDKNASAGTPPTNTPYYKQRSDGEGFKRSPQVELKPSGRIRRCLEFSNEGSPCYHNISPPTPGVGPTVGPIDISDSDDDDDAPNSSCTKRTPFVKRRRVACIVSSDSDDDDIPIGRLGSKKRMKPLTDSSDSDTLPKKRSLVRVAEKIAGRRKNDLGSPEIDDGASEDEKEEDDCEGESLDGFIVNSASDVSESDESDEMSENDDLENDESESGAVYADVIAGFRRERKDKTKWEYEADMLADLAKSPRLCMKAVCALFRQQTSEEQSCKETIVRNGRGFSQIHASTGSRLAEFLTGGDTWGDVKKTEEELQEFDSNGIEQCRKFATHYSKQLFEIYKNDEDPFFHPLEEI